MRLTITLLLLASLAASAEAAPLRWADVRNLALDRNPKLKSAGLTAESSRSELKSTYGNFFPELNLAASRSRRIEDVAGTHTRDRHSAYGLEAKWNLFAGGATIAETRRARAAYEGSQADRDLTSSDLRQALRKAFFDVAYQQDRIALYERIVKRLTQNERLISLKYDSGTEARWNVQKNKADRERAEFDLLSAQNGLRIARDTLAQLLQLDTLPADAVQTASIEEIPLRVGTPEEILPNHPQLRKSGSDLEVANQARVTARAALLPAIDLTYALGRETPYGEGDPAFKRFNAASIGATWNVFNGLSDFYKLQQANLKQEAADLSLVSDRRRVLTEMRTAIMNFETQRAGLPSIRNQRIAAEERVKTVSAQYRAGLKTYLDWEQSESQLISAEEAEVNSIHDALYALADAERAAGRTLEEP